MEPDASPCETLAAHSCGPDGRKQEENPSWGSQLWSLVPSGAMKAKAR